MARLAVLQQFYANKEWQAFRTSIIAERGLTCEHCHKLITHEREATVHHLLELTPDNVHDALISLNPGNVKLVHRACHDAIHHRFGPQTKRVFIVYGMPLSGKRTFVEQQMRRGDLVVSMDQLFEAISGLPSYDKPDSLLVNVRAVYNLLIDQIRTRYGKWGTAWIIGGFPEKFQREKLAEELGAELVYCECSREEALARLGMDERRKTMKADYERYIDEWLERYAE